jgi:tripartite motif-containing protein 71
MESRNLISRALITTLLCLTPGNVSWSQGASETVQLELIWGVFGSSTGEFHQPRGIALDSDGNVVVLDAQNSRVQLFTPLGVFIDSWGMFPPGPGAFSNPSDLCLQGDGDVAVSHETDSYINIFTGRGSYLSEFRTLGRSGSITVDSGGNYYISVAPYDPDMGQIFEIQKLDPAGSSLAVFGKTLLEGISYGVAVTALGDVLVSDTGNSRVLVFDSEGTFLREWLRSGTGAGMVREPKGLALDSAGNTYVVDSGNHRVQLFDSSGGFLIQWGRFGTDPGQFRFPYDIAVDNSGAVYVTDLFNHRIQKFRVDLNGLSLSTPVSPTTWGQLKARYR